MVLIIHNKKCMSYLTLQSGSYYKNIIADKIVLSGHIPVDLFLSLSYTNFMNKLKFNNFKKLRTKFNSSTLYTHFLQSTKSPHFTLRGQIGLLSKKKRVLCWVIYIISLWPRVHESVHTFRQCCIFDEYLALDV